MERKGVRLNVSYIAIQFPAPSETFACLDVRKLKELGADVSVFAMRGKHPNAQEMITTRGMKDVPIVSCGINENLVGLLAMMKYPVLVIKIIWWLLRCDWDKPKHCAKSLLFMPACFYILRKLKKKPPDVLHLFWGHYPSLVGYLVKQALPRVKISMFLGAYDLEYALGISCDFASEADYIFTHAKANLPQLNSLGVNPKRVEVVYRGIDINAFAPFFYEDFFHSKEGYWLAAGRLLQPKRFDIVVEQFSRAKCRGIAEKLIIAGDGPELSALQDLAKSLDISESVVFLGHISQYELIARMRESEFFFLFSQKEGERLPNVVKEAMFAGCVCVVSKTPGIEELLDNSKTGFIVDSLNSSWIELIASLTPENKEDIGKAAQTAIREHFDASNSMKKYLSVWS